MEKRVIIVHGWEATPQSNWFPWLKEQLENLGCQVTVPEMPDTESPVFSAWLAKLKDTVASPDENLYLVGHSLGVITTLRYLESLPEGQQIGGAVLVAGFPEPIGYEEINSFFGKPLDYEKVKKSAKKFVAIHSDNDPYVPMENGEILKDKLGAELIIIKKAGHLNAGDGYGQLPQALDKLKEMMHKPSTTFVRDKSGAG